MVHTHTAEANIASRDNIIKQDPRADAVKRDKDKETVETLTS